MKFHEYANLFPMMAESDLMRLAEDIKEKGQSDAIITYQGEVLDGRNRFKACGINSIAPRFEEYSGDDPLGFVISHNLHRRHLTESQRGMIAAKIATMKQGDNQYQGSPIGEPSISRQDRAEAASQLNVGTSTLDRARRVQKMGTPELVEAVESGEVTVNAAVDVATLPHEEQREVVAQGPAAIKAKAKEIREAAPVPPISTPGKGTPTPKFIPDDAERLWLLAKTDLDKILTTDRSRERVLRKVIAYAQTRIDNKN